LCTAQNQSSSPESSVVGLSISSGANLLYICCGNAELNQSLPNAAFRPTCRNQNARDACGAQDERSSQRSEFSGAHIKCRRKSLVGFVTLFGITLRNSIMMISHYEHLVSVEGVPWGWDAVVRGAMERLVPILMTASVTGLGRLPLALASGDPGSRNRRSDGDCYSRGVGDFDRSEPTCASHSGFAVRQIYCAMTTPYRSEHLH
jgi:AcrB/AcrD/AcrF family